MFLLLLNQRIRFGVGFCQPSDEVQYVMNLIRSYRVSPDIPPLEQFRIEEWNSKFANLMGPGVPLLPVPPPDVNQDTTSFPEMPSSPPENSFVCVQKSSSLFNCYCSPPPCEAIESPPNYSVTLSEDFVPPPPVDWLPADDFQPPTYEYPTEIAPPPVHVDDINADISPPPVYYEIPPPTFLYPSAEIVPPPIEATTNSQKSRPIPSKPHVKPPPPPAPISIPRSGSFQVSPPLSPSSPSSDDSVHVHKRIHSSTEALAVQKTKSLPPPPTTPKKIEPPT